MPTAPGLAAAALAVAAAVAGCTSEAQEPQPLQSVDWRNGPYAVACSATQQTVYENGTTQEPDGGDTMLMSVGYAELDGRPGDEAVLLHLCGAGNQHLSVWRGSDDGPAGVGEVQPPTPLTGVRDWAVDRGVLCVAFESGDQEDSPLIIRAVRLTDAGPVVLDQVCDVPGLVSGTEDDL